MPNYNSKTGIPFGVIHGNNVPELLDDIFTNGDDLTFEQFKEDVKKEIRDAITKTLDQYSFHPEKLADCLDYGDILDVLIDGGLCDSYECDEPEFDYEDGSLKLHLGYLGGAPLIWVLESPFVTRCKQCSPCVPGAGDLDSPDENGMFCYCLPKEEMPEDWTGKIEDAPVVEEESDETV